jgi:MFS family permease
MAIASSLTLLGNTIGPLIGGFAASRFGIRTSFMLASIVLLLLCLLVSRLLPAEIKPER